MSHYDLTDGIGKIDAEGTAPRVVTGSMNWSTAGDERNDKNPLIVHDGGTAMAYAAGSREQYDALDMRRNVIMAFICQKLSVVSSRAALNSSSRKF
jgi:phosphatidylserine/phosphatidylglycerophosphate/cardiolipin synthase-like enzyme